MIRLNRHPRPNHNDYVVAVIHGLLVVLSEVMRARSVRGGVTRAWAATGHARVAPERSAIRLPAPGWQVLRQRFEHGAGHSANRAANEQIHAAPVPVHRVVLLAPE